MNGYGKGTLNKLVDELGAALNEVPLDEEGNPVWDLPAHYIEDDLSDGSDNPLGNLLRGLARELTRRNA